MVSKKHGTEATGAKSRLLLLLAAIAIVALGTWLLSRGKSKTGANNAKQARRALRKTPKRALPVVNTNATSKGSQLAKGGSDGGNQQRDAGVDRGVPKMVGHSIAPAAVPRKIQNEPDPNKRARLLRMHRIATLRARVAILKRRQRLLSKTIRLEAGAKSASKKTLSQSGVKQRVQALETQRRQIKSSLIKTRKRLEAAEQDFAAHDSQ
jgi:hypothetical protein